MCSVSALSQKNFGLLIAYVLPGFVTLWGVSCFSDTVRSWITSSQTGAPTVAGFLYVTLASVATGLIASTVRWAVVDSFHHITGLKPPAWEFAKLEERLGGFLVLVEAHYRYYQFYANMFVAVAFTYAVKLLSNGRSLCSVGWSDLGFAVIQLILLAGSRDTLRKYYSRMERLLGTFSTEERSASDDERCRTNEGSGGQVARERSAVSREERS